MFFVCDGIEYEVVIIKKKNKNTYIRVVGDKIVVTTSYFSSRASISRLLDENRSKIEKMILKSKKRESITSGFSLWGKVYQIVFGCDGVFVDSLNGKIFVKDEKKLDDYLRSVAKDVFYNHLVSFWNCFEEEIPFPGLRVRKMKSRWGVCNTRSHVITLNLELIHYDLECLDYVIVHELSHLIVANHSKDFWSVVCKYYPNYKEIRKKMRELC